MISTGTMVLFIVIPSKACTWITTVKQQDFCSAPFGKLVNNQNSYCKPTYTRLPEIFATLDPHRWEYFSPLTSFQSI